MLVRPGFLAKFATLNKPRGNAALPRGNALCVQLCIALCNCLCCVRRPSRTCTNLCFFHTGRPTTTAVCQARLQKVPMVRLMASVRRMARREVLVIVAMKEFQVLLMFPGYMALALVSMTKPRVAECAEQYLQL